MRKKLRQMLSFVLVLVVASTSVPMFTNATDSGSTSPTVTHSTGDTMTAHEGNLLKDAEMTHYYVLPESSANQILSFCDSKDYLYDGNVSNASQIYLGSAYKDAVVANIGHKGDSAELDAAHLSKATYVELTWDLGKNVTPDTWEFVFHNNTSYPRHKGFRYDLYVSAEKNDLANETSKVSTGCETDALVHTVKFNNYEAVRYVMLRVYSYQDASNATNMRPAEIWMTGEEVIQNDAVAHNTGNTMTSHEGNLLSHEIATYKYVLPDKEVNASFATDTQTKLYDGNTEQCEIYPASDVSSVSANIGHKGELTEAHLSKTTYLEIVWDLGKNVTPDTWEFVFHNNANAPRHNGFRYDLYMSATEENLANETSKVSTGCETDALVHTVTFNDYEAIRYVMLRVYSYQDKANAKSMRPAEIWMTGEEVIENNAVTHNTGSTMTPHEGNLLKEATTTYTYVLPESGGGRQTANVNTTGLYDGEVSSAAEIYLGNTYKDAVVANIGHKGELTEAHLSKATYVEIVWDLGKNITPDTWEFVFHNNANYPRHQGFRYDLYMSAESENLANETSKVSTGCETDALVHTVTFNDYEAVRYVMLRVYSYQDASNATNMRPAEIWMTGEEVEIIENNVVTHSTGDAMTPHEGNLLQEAKVTYTYVLPDTTSNEVFVSNDALYDGEAGTTATEIYPGSGIKTSVQNNIGHKGELEAAHLSKTTYLEFIWDLGKNVTPDTWEFVFHKHATVPRHQGFRYDLYVSAESEDLTNDTNKVSTGCETDALVHTVTFTNYEAVRYVALRVYSYQDNSAATNMRAAEIWMTGTDTLYAKGATIGTDTSNGTPVKFGFDFSSLADSKEELVNYGAIMVASDCSSNDMRKALQTLVREKQNKTVYSADYKYMVTVGNPSETSIPEGYEITILTSDVVESGRIAKDISAMGYVVTQVDGELKYYFSNNTSNERTTEYGRSLNSVASLLQKIGLKRFVGTDALAAVVEAMGSTEDAYNAAVEKTSGWTIDELNLLKNTYKAFTMTSVEAKAKVTTLKADVMTTMKSYDTLTDEQLKSKPELATELSTELDIEENLQISSEQFFSEFVEQTIQSRLSADYSLLATKLVAAQAGSNQKLKIATLGDSFVAEFSNTWGTEYFKGWFDTMFGEENVEYVNAGCGSNTLRLVNYRMDRDLSLTTEAPDIVIVSSFKVHTEDDKYALETILKRLLDKKIAVIGVVFPDGCAGVAGDTTSGAVSGNYGTWGKANSALQEILEYYHVPVLNFSNALKNMDTKYTGQIADGLGLGRFAFHDNPHPSQFTQTVVGMAIQDELNYVIENVGYCLSGEPKVPETSKYDNGWRYRNAVLRDWSYYQNAASEITCSNGVTAYQYTQYEGTQIWNGWKIPSNESITFTLNDVSMLEFIIKMDTEGTMKIQITDTNDTPLKTIESFDTSFTNAYSWNCGECGTTAPVYKGHLLSGINETNVKVTITCTQGTVALLALAVVPNE